jgi:hypothetical protein
VHVVERLALASAPLERAQVRVSQLLVAFKREKQGDIDVDTLVQGLLDRGDARFGAGDLDHQVGPIDPAPVIARLGQRAGRIVSEVRRKLEAHIAVSHARFVVRRSQDVARRLYVSHDQIFVDLVRRQAAGGFRVDLFVIQMRAGDGVVERLRIRGNAAQRLVAHTPCEVPPAQSLSIQIVQPIALSVLRQLQQGIHFPALGSPSCPVLRLIKLWDLPNSQRLLSGGTFYFSGLRRYVTIR